MVKTHFNLKHYSMKNLIKLTLIVAFMATGCFTAKAASGDTRGVWANQISEVVLTDSIMMYFSRDTVSGCGIVNLKVPTRNLNYAISFSKDTIIYKKGSLKDDISLLADGKLSVNGEKFQKVESIETVEPYDMPIADSRETVSKRLQEWQLGSYVECGGDEFYVSIGTNKNSFICGKYHDMVYLRAAALQQCYEGSVFTQNIRMMKNTNTGEVSNNHFQNQLEFLTHLPEIDKSKFQPDKCFFGKNGEIYWSYVKHTPDQIQINGCGETYTFSRRTKANGNLMEWFKFEP